MSIPPGSFERITRGTIEAGTRPTFKKKGKMLSGFGSEQATPAFTCAATGVPGLRFPGGTE